MSGISIYQRVTNITFTRYCSQLFSFFFFLFTGTRLTTLECIKLFLVSNRNQVRWGVSKDQLWQFANIKPPTWENWSISETVSWTVQLTFPLLLFTMLCSKSWEGVRDRKVTGSFKGHFVHAFLLGKPNCFHFIPYYFIIIIPRKCSSGVERLMTFSGPTHPLFSFVMLFDSLRRDCNESSEMTGVKAHTQSSDGHWRPQRHLPATAFWQAGSKLKFISARYRNRSGESRRRESHI